MSAPRPFSSPAKNVTARHKSVKEIENNTFAEQKMEATRLELQAKYGTITAEGQERLTVLQTKMDEILYSSLDRASQFGHNFANIPVRRPDIATPIQAKLTIGEPGDKYEQQADETARQVVQRIDLPQSDKLQRETLLGEDNELQMQPGGSVQRKSLPQEEDKSQIKPMVQRVSDSGMVTGDVIQRVSVKDAIKIFENIATKEGADIKQQADIKKRQADIKSAGLKKASTSKLEEKPSQQQPETEATDSQLAESKPPTVEGEPQELKSQLPSNTSSNSEPTSANPNKEANDLNINKQVEANLNVLADGFFAMYKPEDFGGKDGFKKEYDETMQSVKKFLPDLILKRKQENPDASGLLSFDEIGEEYQKHEETLKGKKVEEQIKPRTTGKDRWNKLKKIVITDPSLPQIKGKSKPLTHKDIVSQVRAEAKTRAAELGDTNHESYWLEAWDALHRPAFMLAGKDLEEGHFENWMKETAILEWLNEQENRDKEMMAAFNDQKQQESGEANFWTWKAKSKYANTSPPPPTISFWDWLKQKNISIEGVQYLESEAERRPRGVTVSGGKWQDAFGDSLSSLGMEAIGAPNDGQDWMIFVLSPDGKFYADAHKQGKYHHSSALAGIPVKGAGAIRVDGGKLEAICDKSGHYKPNPDQMYATLRHLQKNGGVDPKTYKVSTRDLGDMQGDKWIEKYLKTQVSNKRSNRSNKDKNS
ncbi:hypothetical protein GNF10_05965 [Nostoc sp. UCD121]|uniref:hypothetical protein n=1 Tax=Nostoc sp. UCD121 TaxID=2681305 RepID=UPI00162AF06C|nr:hypothetical protein [Nostoc sp. UCD121]MBC1275542.1 hypothetical protein [Nostoc sp. UCD121]MBC1296719.1 hypothetical protein [Nostoc sp. UCD122]